MANSKSKSEFICENCEYKSPKWLGQCPECKEWNSFVEKTTYKTEAQLSHRLALADEKSQQIQSLADQLPAGKRPDRIASGFDEFDLVLGGGFLADQVVFLSGEPGVGKSTLLLQSCAHIAGQHKVLYVSAEESASQVADRVERLGLRGQMQDVGFLGTGHLQEIISHIDEYQPQVVVIDSIQTLFDAEISSVSGSVTQVRSCATALISLAKSKGFLLILVGHINKDGSIAGPKVLEHLVDTVVQFEGGGMVDYRILRGGKNRFGQAGEVGLLVMGEQGLQDIDPKTNIFINSSVQQAIGVARTVVVEGQRPVLVEIQALVGKSVYNYPKRVAEGISNNRLQMICAIVSKFSKIDLSASDVYVRVTGGYSFKDSAADLAVAMAIISSAQKKPLLSSHLYLGELNLSAGVLPVRFLQQRLQEVVKFGVEEVVLSKGNDKGVWKKKRLQKLQISQVDSLRDIKVG